MEEKLDLNIGGLVEYIDSYLKYRGKDPLKVEKNRSIPFYTNEKMIDEFNRSMEDQFKELSKLH